MQDNSFFNECSHLDQVLNLSTYLSDEVNDIIKIASSSNANIAAKESMIYFDPWLQKDNLILMPDLNGVKESNFQHCKDFQHQKVLQLL